MSAPMRAELQHALLEIRQAAEKLKVYEPRFVEQLQGALRAHAGTIGRAADLPADLRARCQQIAAQGGAVVDSMERARQYPEHIMARADVLDRTGMLAKMIRDLLARLAPPPAR